MRGLGNIDIVGMDMMEVAPSYDHAEVTALAAASLILDFLCMRSAHLPSRI
jgi:agmatinase